MDVQEIRAIADRMRREVRKAVVGQDEVIDLMLTSLLVGGHILLEGVPGTAKTLISRAFAASLALHFGRIQFTPDLMPGDVLGTNLFNFQTNSFILTPGPIFTQLLLADEINRTPPKTQAALLQAMNERIITIDGKDYELGEDFMVVATQNPIEQQGTYPLPEAQLDRFMFKLNVPFLNRAELNEMVRRTTLGGGADVPKIMDGARILALRAILEKVVVADPIRDYAVRLVLSTHPDAMESGDNVKRFVKWGASPRAVQALIRAARVRALAEGRAHVA
ncbi:MAG TPA: AAA family ATPase, partial [Xanthobacteraceae bacterium]|nr:AAA family ATPase [Xanthobacteraceae bacterium]